MRGRLPRPSTRALRPTSKRKSPEARCGTCPREKREQAAIAAFAANCHHVFTTIADDVEGGEEKPECESRTFEQNCAPDQNGCWDALQACKDACASPCSSCQSTCASACDACKSKCSGDGGCVLECATTRQKCRDDCLWNLDQCQGAKCEGESSECEAQAAAALAKECPDCAGIRSCLSKAMEKPDFDEREANGDCLQKFPEANRSCFDLCNPGQ